VIREKLQERLDLKVWPQLYAKASTGKIKTWQSAVTKEPDDTAILWTFHGYVDENGNADSKMQLKPKPIKIGKNIGKKNETTPYEQACKQAQSKNNKQRDKRYITEIPDGTNEPEIYLPMRAYKVFREDYIRLPCIVQSKFNGVRSLSDKQTERTINLTSKMYKSYNEVLFHLFPYLLEIQDVLSKFDGEIYYHGWSLNKISRHVKKLRPDTHKLQYWVYDVADPTMRQDARIELYQNAIPDNHSHIIKVPSPIAYSMDDINRIHTQNLQNGFEGSIVRNMDALYEFDFRSHNLIKKKDFTDSEFMIVGGKAEEISEEDADGNIVTQRAVVFICQMDDGSNDTFDVRPKGSVALRVKWLNEIDSLIGKYLTIRYEGRTDYNKPQGPIGQAIRDYE